MAHNINSMAYHDEVPWHGLGTRLDRRGTAREMIRAAGLDWRVEKQPVVGSRQDRCQLMRKARSSRESDVLLGVATSRYEVLQNEDAFGFFDPIVGADAAVFETAGALGDGERVWVLAKLPGEIRVIDDDIVNKYLLLSNSHDGKHSVAVRFTPIRVVCQNTLMLALEGGGKTVKVRHTSRLASRLAKVPDELGIIVPERTEQQTLSLSLDDFAAVEHVFATAEKQFQALARTKLDQDQLTAYLDEVLLSAQERADIDRRGRPARWEHVQALFEEADGIESIKGTLWAAYNAVTRYEDYRETREASPDRRLGRVWFGAGADLKLRALLKAVELGSTWPN